MSQPGAWAGPPDPQGSIEIWTHEVSRRLADLAAVRVYRPGSGVRTERSIHDGVEYLAISGRPDQMLSRLFRIVRRRRPHQLSLWHCLGYAIRVAIGLLGYRPDVVHVQNQFPFVRVIRWFNRRVPIVLHMHGEWLSDLDPSIVRPALDRVDRIVAVSDHVAERIRAAWPERAQDCVTVPNGVPAQWLAAPAADPEQPSILFVGRLSPEKGLHVLVDAFDRLAESHPTATLTIVGPRAVMPIGHLVEVSDDPVVRDLARFYGDERYPEILADLVPPRLRHRVEFRATVPHRELEELYRRATVLVNPSLSEAFGMSVIEAMATGTPVVASAVGGMREILAGGVGGVLVPPGDAAALAAAITELLDDPAERRHLGVTGRARVAARFTWDLVAADIGFVYAAVEDGVRTKPIVGARFDRLVSHSVPIAVEDLSGPTLVVAPHPDDETLGCGGTIAALTAAGHQVGVVFLTDGALAGTGDRAATVEARMAEAFRACEILGVKPAHTWTFGLPDGGLRSHRQEAVPMLAEVFDSFTPARVFLPHAHDGHPDHEAAFWITDEVIRDRRAGIAVYEYAIWLWDHWPWTPQPMPWPPSRRQMKVAGRAWRRTVTSLRRNDLATLDGSVDIASTAWIKRGALRAYRSQLPSLSEVGRGRFLRWFAASHELFRVVRG